MKRSYRTRLDRLQAAQSRRATLPQIPFSDSPEAVALRRELLDIASREAEAHGWDDVWTIRQGLLQHDRVREVMALLAEAEAGLTVTAREDGPTDESTT
jgi:hypothetical protein